MTDFPTDLFDWADNRPTAVVLDANRRIRDRIRAYQLYLYLNPDAPEIHADIVELRPHQRGAA